MYIGEDYGGLFPPSLDDRMETRRELSRIIELALAMLDALDPDPDREPDGDDLDQSGPEWFPGYPIAFHGCALPHEDDEDGGDAEPMLGWREARAGGGLCPTLHDDAEDDGHSEPILAAPEGYSGFRHERLTPEGWFLSGRIIGKAYDQTVWADGVANDREEDAGDEPEPENEHGGDILDEPHDDDDSGIADEDGIWEQEQREAWA